MMLSTETKPLNAMPTYWMKGLPGLIANGFCGVIAIFVAIQAVSFEPHAAAGSEQVDHIVRILSFAGLTAWVTFAIGIRRRGAAAIIVLVFATFLELVIVPIRSTGLSTIASANLGIVLAYCAAQLYWLVLQGRDAKDGSHIEPAKD